MTRRIALTDVNRRWWTLGAMCFALFMIMLDNTVVNVALPSIQQGLHASISGLQWTVNAYTLPFAVLLVTAGRLGDLFGRRRMFLFGVMTFATASGLIALAQTDAWLVAFRAVQGVGAAFMMPATLSIAWHLEREGHKPPAPATISRILQQAGLIVAQPRKRPRSSYTRFEMAQPNEMWQSDFIHWQLADGTDIEVLNWLDDHSRYLLSCSAHQPVTGDDVVTVFLGLVEQYGPPASTLTDNGRVYTARFGGGRNAFEYLLPLLGVRQKNGSPGHPQTQGKTERFHQTLQRWLRARPPAQTLTQLQRQLDEFRGHYNELRPHRALHRRTPGEVYRATPKAAPASNGHAPGHYRLRYDRLDIKGRMTIRRAGRMHHLGIGAAHARKRVLAFADDDHVTVADLTTGEVLSVHLIEPTKSYWRNQNKEPGRWPGSPQ